MIGIAMWISLRLKTVVTDQILYLCLHEGNQFYC